MIIISLLDSRFHELNGWSHSRHNQWSECKKAYFFQYLGVYYTGKKDYDVSKLYHLKRLNPKKFLLGSLIHEVIKNQLGQKKLARPLNQESAINLYLKWVEDKKRFARDYLVEPFNGEPIENEFFEKIKADGTAQLKTFFEIVWPNLKDLDYVSHEEFEHFKINGITVTLKPDYVSKSKDGTFVISDWKTGADNENFDNDLQIATYVLWAKEKFQLNSSDIHSELIYLSSGNMRSFNFKDDDLEKFKTSIVGEFRQMNEKYEIESYPPNPSQKLCNSCRFSTICCDTKTDYTPMNKI